MEQLEIGQGQVQVEGAGKEQGQGGRRPLRVYLNFLYLYKNHGSDFHKAWELVTSLWALMHECLTCSRGSTSSATEAPKLSIESPNNSPAAEVGSDGCNLARVILPDKATTVVQTRSGESIRAMVSRLLEKRGLRYGFDKSSRVCHFIFTQFN